MPAFNRNHSPSLPGIDEAVAPFSSLFGGSFDLATVESSTQLADNSVFITSTGSRFRFTRIPETNGSRAPIPPAAQNHNGPQSTTASARQPLSVSSGHGGGRERNDLRRGSSQEPKVPTADVSTLMGHLNIERFGASALYGLSDGGAQAAESLTDRHPVNIRPVEHGFDARRSIGLMSYPQDTPTSQYRHNIQTNVAMNVRYSDGSYGSARHSLPLSTASLQPSLPSLTEYSSSTSQTSSMVFPPQTPSGPTWNSPDDVGVRYEGGARFDTQTPIVIQVQEPSTKSPSDGSSAGGRDNVLPGEELLYSGGIKTAQNLAGPFVDASLKVFRNTLANDLRFHCRVGSDSETHWLKGSNAQLVPIYAYDQRSPNILYIRETGRNTNSTYQVSQGGTGPSGIYQFAQLQDLFKFQSKLTGEDVVLDISSVKWVKLAKANTRSNERYSSVRLQIWHEPRSRKTMQSDVASFVTAGTTLSGPVRDRVVPNSSRLMVFLGRAEEYITCFVTDDIEIEQHNQTCVRLKPRKYGGLHRRSARPGIKAQLYSRGTSEPAGLDIHGELFNPDVEGSFDVYKTFEIEFESSPSQVNFVQAWKEVLEERRKQRARLNKIQEEMRLEAYTANLALEIRM